MAHRNIRDASLVKSFVLPAAQSLTVTSAVIDTGVDTHKPETVEVVVDVPALTTTQAPDTKTATVIIETSTTSVFTAVDATILTAVLTGAGGVGIAATQVRARLQSTSARYIRAKITFGALMTDSSALSANLALAI